ncbi:MAG: SPOR domain-containing protein [Gammaproteobacteria bacterium]|nr:SPOR domain-containing protein [Gammaproteobacteria bacterium]
MDRKLRKRIIGAIVLAAFLVILVPEWLDGAGHKSRYSNKVEIPDKPEFKPIADYIESTDSAVTINKRIKSEESSVHAWALQLGSFSRESNAEAMRDKLRAKGYASYVDVLKKPDRTTYRVRIGPELDKKRLEQIKLELGKKEKMKGMLVQHP